MKCYMLRQFDSCTLSVAVCLVNTCIKLFYSCKSSMFICTHVAIPCSRNAFLYKQFPKCHYLERWQNAISAFEFYNGATSIFHFPQCFLESVFLDAFNQKLNSVFLCLCQQPSPPKTMQVNWFSKRISFIFPLPSHNNKNSAHDQSNYLSALQIIASKYDSQTLFVLQTHIRTSYDESWKKPTWLANT